MNCNYLRLCQENSSFGLVWELALKIQPNAFLLSFHFCARSLRCLLVILSYSEAVPFTEI